MKTYYLELITEHYSTQCVILTAGCFIAPDKVWMFAGFFVMLSIQFIHRHVRESKRLEALEKEGNEL